MDTVCLWVFLSAYVYCREIYAHGSVECLLLYLHDSTCGCERVCACVCRHVEHVELLNALMEATSWLKATSVWTK